MYKRNKNVKSGAAIRARFQAGQKKKIAPETLPRKTDLSATRVEPSASTPTRTQSPVLAFRQRALEARRKRASEKAKEKELAKAKQTAAKSKEPKRRANESITVFRQRLAKYRRENKS